MQDCQDESFSLQTFSAYVRDEFRVTTERGDVVLTLAEVSELGSGRDTKTPGRRGPFSLLFVDPQGSVDNFLPQGTYRFSHAAFAELEIFIVPVGPCQAGSGMQYDATFT